MDNKWFLFLSAFAGILLLTEGNDAPTWDSASVDAFPQGFSEALEPGVFLTQLKCTDPDGDMIQYGLRAGKAVRVKSDGKVYLAEKLDFEQEDTLGYALTFTCVDIDSQFGFELHERVEIRTEISVNDANDNPPVFAVSGDKGYTFLINEDREPPLTLAPIIMITDADRTVNAQLDQFYLICASPNATERVGLTESSIATCEKFFVTSTQTGEGKYAATLRLKSDQTVDYETRAVYSSKLIAIDNPSQSGPKFTTTVNVQITVIDAQDVDPLFTNAGTTSTVSEGRPVGSQLNFAISAMDGDLGAKRRVAIEIIEDPREAFNLTTAETSPNTEDDGVYHSFLIVNNQLDRESLTGAYSFVVKATELDVDGTKTTATATATYSVFVSDVNDEPPRFSKDMYNVSVTEMEQTDQSVQVTGLRIDCRDADEPTNARYNVRVVEQQYNMQGNPKSFQAYSVSPAVGHTGAASMFLRVDNAAYLDYDNPEYRVQRVVLEAKETRNPAKFSSSTTISIYLTDINDNAPVFSQTSYNFQVNENVQPPYAIKTIVATDKDSGLNGEVEYTLEGGISDTFRIGRTSGELTLTRAVDYETTPEFVFLVIAEDQSQQQKFSQAQVTVQINNINDQGPVFVQPIYQTSANETSLSFLNPIRVIAVDNEDDGNPVTYSIVAGQSPDNAFRIDRISGELGLNYFLDYGKTPKVNGRNTGEFRLTIEATDNGDPEQINTVIVLVRVIDENNHPPVLNQTIFNVRLPEIAPGGTFVAQLSGTDQDSGDNGEITYRIGDGQSDNFAVNPTSGLVTVGATRDFDVDLTEFYTVTILATDGGAPQRNATATINVQILDSNNKPPSFSSVLFLQDVDENEPVNHIVLTARATDPDATARLEYYIDEGTIRAQDPDGNELASTFIYDWKNAFAVNQEGQIYIKNKLQKKYAPEITFTLVVEDKETQSGSAVGTTQVTLIITGEIETDITFDAVNQVFMNEDAPRQYEPIVVTARDPNNNAVSDYRKLPGSSANFEVGAQTGSVRLITPIDYENDPQRDHLHQVIVEARSENGQESATVTVTISIVDMNDNAPEFTKTEYIAEISENAVFPDEVVTVYATDKDSSSYGPLQYRIAGGLDSTDFEIFNPMQFSFTSSRRAQVIVAEGKRLDYNKRRQYNLDIIVGDNRDTIFSNVRRFSRSKLTINVRDENNHAPKFKETDRRLAVPETADVGRSIATMIATDDDFGSNGEIVYSLEPVNEINNQDSIMGLSLFKILPTLGIIQVARPLLGLGNKEYPLRVRARDRGDVPNSNFTTVTINVLSVEADDGNPKWLSPLNGYVVYAPEEVVGYKLADVNGNHQFFNVIPRTGEEIEFSLSPYGEFASSFSINPITGEITIIGKLDREIQETYNLLVIAADKNNTKTLRTGRQLYVTLSDVNDNEATFTNPKGYDVCFETERPLTILLKENTQRGHRFFELEACDPDTAQFNEIDYEPYLDNDYCKNNRPDAIKVTEDGWLETTKIIDYEESQEFIMCVKAHSKIPVDPANASNGRKKRAFDMSQIDNPQDNVAYINIIVLDENDNGPKFADREIYSVLETEPQGELPVVILNAIDLDGRGNSITLYQINATNFYPQGDPNPRPAFGTFLIRGDRGALYPNLPSYDNFAGGRFVVQVVAVDQSNNRLQDVQNVIIYVYEKGQAVKVILDLLPSDGFMVAEPLVNELDAITEDYIFMYLQVSEHRTEDGRDSTKTDVCFLAVEGSSQNILNIRQIIDLLDQDRYYEVLRDDKYQYADRGQCFPQKSSEDNTKWKDLWWVLVAVAIFIGVCCLILMVLVCGQYRKYKRYMESRKTYMVPQ